MKKYVFGVDLGGTTVKIGFFKTDGTMLSKWEIPTNTSEQGKHILGDIQKEIQGKLEKESILPEEVEGIGIGVPGPVKEDGTVLGCVNLGWGTFQIAKELEKLTGLKVKAGNDANVAALGEMYKGGGQGYGNLVMVTLGTGVGGGIIVNEKIVAGANGAGGEIGHIHVADNEEDVCGCGRQGCLEQYASATGIVRMAKKRLQEQHEKSLLDQGNEITAKLIFDCAKEGDAVAVELVEKLGKILGMALSNICLVVNPDIIVIGGGVSKAGEILIQTIQKHFCEEAFLHCKDTKFGLAKLGNDAGMYGCVKLLLEG